MPRIGLLHAVTGRFSRHFRSRRMREFVRIFGVSEQTRILDVGGTTLNWQLIPQHPRVTILNLYPPDDSRHPFRQVLPDNVAWVVGDGRALPFRNDEFDIVFSNSVIEHLGDYSAQRELAEELMRVGKYYYVQTPNRKFPIEPHYAAPLIHFFPKSWQRRLLPNFTLWGWAKRPTPADVEEMLAELRLLDFRELAEIFPDAQIRCERSLGMTKSFVVVGHSKTSRLSRR